MATKKYLDYAGLKRVLAKLLPGARKIWHGTLAEWEALSEAERDKYDQAEIIDGSGYQSGYVRRPAWDQAVVISAEQLYAGYTAPSDGMIVCNGVMPNINSQVRRAITVNGIDIAIGEYTSGGVFSYSSTSCPVSKGDLIKSNTNEVWPAETRYFIPFEDSTVSDIEVVTPEYIRNQNILSDLESITISTSSSSPTVMPYDGVIYIRYKASGSTPGKYYLNGQHVLWFEGAYGTASNSGTLTVKKGDTVYVEFNGASPSAFARFYKLRDYTGR